MRRGVITPIVALVIAVLVAAPAAAQDLEKGLAAYDSGDYETAFRELRSLAEGG